MSHDSRPMNLNNLGMHPMMYPAVMGHSMDNHNIPGVLSASQAGPNVPDSSMTGMLEDDLLEDFDNLPNMNLDGLGDTSHLQKPFTPLSNMMSPIGNEQSDTVGSLSTINGDNGNGGIGAGPLPTGFGLQSSITNGSTLTDFTKRRNWSQKVVEEIKDFLHILTPNGRLIYVSPSSKSLTGYTSEELSGKFIVDYIHPDDSAMFVREFNESIASGNPLRFFYRWRKKDQSFTIFESHGHPHIATGEAMNYNSTDSAEYCRGFFMMARPYPTKNAALLDSFLEHKIENERLKRRISDLRREEQEESEEAQRRLNKQDDRSNQPSETTGTIASSVNTPIPSRSVNSDLLAMPPPARPTFSNDPLTRQNLDEVTASGRPDSINDKMLRYEGASRIDQIEMLTGLQYREGERSHGISTGDQSPALIIRGDAGIAIPIDKDGRAADKKRKIKLPDEYVCTDCGTLDSPEWRKGPSGPKTLCNACGLRWAKKEKKRTPTAPSAQLQQGVPSSSSHPPPPPGS
ncbi:Cutinase palindrome-binding protein [Rutstroemia sp. NJR-2017a BBW]|nr:Cutinase palindrome-binding protein [Rutstroemia sp. NJR-2017a BBW]